MYRLRNIIILCTLATVLLAASCRKQETVAPPPTRVQLSLNPSSPTYTRGSGELTGSTLGTDNSYVMNVSASTPSVPFFMSGQLFSYISASGKWEASSAIGEASPVYWPIGDESMDFLAVAGTPSALTALDPEWDGSVPANRFTISSWDTYTDQWDLMYAVANDQTAAGSGGTVNLEFRHALALIMFEIKVDNADVAGQLGVTVSDISFPGLLTSGALTVDNSRNTLAASWDFDDADPASAFVPASSGTVSPFLSGSVASCVDFDDAVTSTTFVQLGDGLLVPPQRALNFVMHYTVGSHDYTYTFNDTHRFWTGGRSYVYGLTLRLYADESGCQVLTDPITYGYEEF